MRWLHRLFQKSRAEQQLDKELRFHLDRQIADHLAAGLSAEEARRRANLEFGGVDRVKEEVRDTRWETHLDNLLRDFRYALRSLRKDRRFAIVAIFALALGIGASTVIFSVIYNGLLHPFPYKDADGISIFQIHDLDQGHTGGRGMFSVSEFLDYREQNHVFADMVGTSYAHVLYTYHDGVMQLTAAKVTPNTFEFLGVPPILGRWITAEDGRSDASPVVLINYRFWKEQFGGNPNIVGTTLTLNNLPATVIGIMPSRFQYFGADVWLPLILNRNGISAQTSVGDDPPRYVIAEERRKPGVTLEAAAADLDVIAHRLCKLYPKDYPKRFNVWTDTLASDVVGDFKGTLYILLSAVAMLLLIACSNVANLLLARATTRQKEIGIRGSLGATRGRLIRQLFVESFVLATAGCLAGCAFAFGGLKWVVAAISLGGGLPGEASVTLNFPALLFAAAITMLITLLCGLAPALHAVNAHLQTSLAGSGKGVNANFGHATLRSSLVIVEVALSLVLLIGAGLMMRSFLAITHVDLGFNTKNVFVAGLSTPKGSYDTPEKLELLYQPLLQRIAAIPGVVAVSESWGVPPFDLQENEIVIPGKSHSETWRAALELCSEGYFKTLEFQAIRGRLLSETDINSARHVAVINEAFARNYFGEEDPIGHTIKFNFFDELPGGPKDAYFEIIGLTRDFKNAGVQNPPIPQAFIPYTVTGARNRAILVRTSTEPLAFTKTITQEIWAIDRNIALPYTGTLESFMHRFSYARPEFGFKTLGAFAGIGLLLVIIGVFSVMAYTVSLQTHEFGIRLALGAQRRDVLTMVLGKGLVLVASGALIGVVASTALTHFLASQIWGVSATDPLTFVLVIALVTLFGLCACLLPARHAASVDPLVALRYE
jgi:putative ABC transport system permease protein